MEGTGSPPVVPAPQLSEPSLHAGLIRADDDSIVRAVVCATLAMLTLCGAAFSALTPARSRAAAAPVTAIALTGESLVYTVARTPRSCGVVVLWDTRARRTWSFGHRTLLGCEEGPSGGFGITSVSVAGRRAFWLTHIGGNITDWRLWTATPTRPAPRSIAAASADTDGPAPIVLGGGTQSGVPYAVGDTVTLVADTGARLFRTTLGSRVRLLASSRAPGDTPRVVAALDDGRVVRLSGDGDVLRTDRYAPGAVTAIALGARGMLVQSGVEVTGDLDRTELPAGATMLDHAERTIFYRRGSELRSRSLATGSDRLLRTFAVRRWQPLLFAADGDVAAWATGRVVGSGAWRR